MDWCDLFGSSKTGVFCDCLRAVCNSRRCPTCSTKMFRLAVQGLVWGSMKTAVLDIYIYTHIYVYSYIPSLSAVWLCTACVPSKTKACTTVAPSRPQPVSIRRVQEAESWGSRLGSLNESMLQRASEAKRTRK